MMATNNNTNNAVISTKATRDPKQQAVLYLESKKIKTLFELLTSRLIIKQPDDSINFLIDELQKIKVDQAQNKKIYEFSQNELESMFDAFDVTQKGFISNKQLKEGNLNIQYKDLK